jgi:LEA14-like dessication related protein
MNRLLRGGLTFPLPFAIVLFLMACKNFKEPELQKIDNMRFEKLGKSESILKLDLKYHNPNPFQVKLKKASGNAWLDGKMLGQFTLDSSIAIPANAGFSLPVSLGVDMSKLLQNTLRLLVSNEVMLKIEGTARISKSGITINYPLKYEGKQNLQQLLGNSQVKQSP